MVREINDRLIRLNNRRKGTDRIHQIDESFRSDVLAKSYAQESWQKREMTRPYTRYALGAMQEVNAEYTKKSIDEATRVSGHLKTGLAAVGIPVVFELQGSVPLNVHIRGVSDVDLLTLAEDFFTYTLGGVRDRSGYYRSPTTRTSLGVLGNIRTQAEVVLKRRFWGATVDCSGGKSISLSGGSLERPVDVVPSHYHDTLDYQRSGLAHERGVIILNKKVPETIENLPFLHIHRINERDRALLGGLKMAIRLAKTVKSDATNEASAAQLPSFDIAALMYHANQDALRIGFHYELAVLEETQRFFDWCYRYESQSSLLRTPDGSRPILNTSEKRAGLLTISCELDDLVKAVRAEQFGDLRKVIPAA
jgi:hypothetical protein